MRWLLMVLCVSLLVLIASQKLWTDCCEGRHDNVSDAVNNLDSLILFDQIWHGSPLWGWERFLRVDCHNPSSGLRCDHRLGNSSAGVEVLSPSSVLFKFRLFLYFTGMCRRNTEGARTRRSDNCRRGNCHSHYHGKTVRFLKCKLLFCTLCTH